MTKLHGVRQRQGPDLELAAGRTANAVHAQMCALTTWFVTHVPFSYDFSIDHHRALRSHSLDDILMDLVDMKYGALCGALSLFMASAAKRRGYDAIALNFGNDCGPQSHVLVLVAIGNGERVIYDPTLGCFSGKIDGTPVSIQMFIELLRLGRGEELRWIDIGPRERPFMFRAGTPPRFPLTSAVKELDQSRSVAMIDLRFMASVTWNAIWEWARPQKPGVRTIFDCLRFPISTSGEAEAEALADQLRSIS